MENAWENSKVKRIISKVKNEFVENIFIHSTPRWPELFIIHSRTTWKMHFSIIISSYFGACSLIVLLKFLWDPLSGFWYFLFFIEKIFLQAQVHRHSHNFREVQQCTLLSIKTGGCSEDCSYCPQSSRYDTGLKAQKLMNEDAVLDAARKVLCSVSLGGIFYH